MKNLVWLGAALLLLAGCGGDSPEPAAPESPATEPVAEETEAPEAPAAGLAEDDVLEVVEESASEPEPEEQTIMLAQAETAALSQQWQFKENQHYFRLVPTQPTVGGADKIEVAEFFWYGCPHCFEFERHINPWAESKPANVRFVRIPAMWNRGLQLHAQLYYTEEALARSGALSDPAAFREAVFIEYHRRGNRLASKDAIQQLFTRFGVSAEEFERTWTSFEVNQKLRVADDLARRYGISNVPAMVVNGKYRTGGSEAGSYVKLLEVLDELIAKESSR